jgi:Uma2 family endonuclease
MNTLQSNLLEVLKEPALRENDLRRRVVEALLAPSKPSKMSYEEFLAWLDEDTLAEWVNGEVIMGSPASRQHQLLSGFLYKLLDAFVEKYQSGVVLLPPFLMKLQSAGREPDLIFIAQPHLSRLKETYLDGPADLVVEITSPESRSRDRGEKFIEFEQAGIPEYWLIDPDRKRTEFYQLDEAGTYRLVFPDEQDNYHSAILPGFWLRVSWLWHLPPVMETLRELGII